jgi:NADPH:quinone reductase-like Zn-dependent oxidoreductase
VDHPLASVVSQSLWYVAPERTEIRSEILGPLPENNVQVRSLFSALSRGTESLVFKGLIPESEYTRMGAPFMGGKLPFPVKYGYSNVGRIELGPPELIGQLVFSLMPHQSVFQNDAANVLVIPKEIPAHRAVLAAYMETALNAVWDASPGPGDRIVIIGAGVLGCLVAYICGHLLGIEVTLVDINPEREEIAKKLGVQFSSPELAPKDGDVVIHCSATAAGLSTAIASAGEETTILELSWYGANKIDMSLGGAFHSRQLKLQSSQVGHISSSRRPRWSHRRRLAAALGMLSDPRLDCLLMKPIHFEALPSELPQVFSARSSALCCLIQYS